MSNGNESGIPQNADEYLAISILINGEVENVVLARENNGIYSFYAEGGVKIPVVSYTVSDKTFEDAIKTHYNKQKRNGCKSNAAISFLIISILYLYHEAYII